MKSRQRKKVMVSLVAKLAVKAMRPDSEKPKLKRAEKRLLRNNGGEVKYLCLEVLKAL